MQDFNQQDHRHAKLINRYAQYIQSPVLRLKFLSGAMKTEPRHDWQTKLPLIGSLPERAMLILELSKVLPLNQPAPIGIRITSLLYRLRFAVYGVCLALALSLGASLIYMGSKIISSLSVSTEARGNVAPAQIPASAAGAEAVAAIGSEAGLGLDKVWLAETGDGYEFYSNGARVLIKYETTGANRSFYRFTADALAGKSDDIERLSKPVGIVYHISESDLLPFADRYNASLQTRSKSLLDYARERKLYNYLIDRFGRTYRIVRDEFACNHAGNSTWSDDRGVYINLNTSFIGVCFEGRSERGGAVGPDRINEAQIYAARVLTAVLRSKYEINDANCVTHGLVSVNPSNNLMGYHTDWVAGFPFEAIGLSNKYETELAAISRLGFTYDQSYLAAAGGRKWPGLEKAEAALKEAAGGNGLTIEEERRSRERLFQQAYLKQRALDRSEAAGGE